MTPPTLTLTKMASPCAEDNDYEWSKSTTKVTKGSKTIFQDYLKEKEIRFPDKSEELAVILPNFFSEVRKKDGSPYTKNSLCALRFGLNRYFKQHFNVDIIKDKSFDDANRAYGAQCRNLKDIGLDKAEHKPPISDEDIKKLYECGIFSTEAPNTLQNKVFFELILYFCRRGRQNLRQLRKDDFVIKMNPQGQKYVVKSGDTTELNDGYGGGIMVATGNPLCPVFSFEKYLTHLNPLNEFLFQRSRENCSDGIVWYDNVVVGENTLGRKMRLISVQAKLSVEYTNHSIRVTAISILNRNAYLAKHMDIRGHKSENSKVKFCNRTSKNSETKMADCLLSAVTQKLSGSVGNKSAAISFSNQTKKRKLDDEFSKESPKNEDAHIALPVATRVTVPPDNHDENVAPEEQPASPQESISRRKAPRSQVRKFVRTELQSNGQEKINVPAPLVKSQTASKECSEEPPNHERQVQYMVQDISNTTTCGVLSSPRNENISIETVRESRISSTNVESETTAIEEDYQRKYFQLLNTMNDLQDKFLNSQRNFEDLVKAREAFIEELKCKLENNHQEISTLKQELATSNNNISELEEKRRVYEKDIQNLSEKVEDMKVRQNEVKHEVLKDREAELQGTIEKQQEVLDFYKMLTSVTVEKVVEDEDGHSSTVYDKFRCSVKTAHSQDLQFLLSHDPEFAEIEYTPLAVDSLDCSFPQYLNEQIFFESSQAPNFLLRLIQTFQNPDDK